MLSLATNSPVASTEPLYTEIVSLFMILTAKCGGCDALVLSGHCSFLIQKVVWNCFVLVPYWFCKKKKGICASLANYLLCDKYRADKYWKYRADIRNHDVIPIIPILSKIAPIFQYKSLRRLPVLCWVRVTKSSAPFLHGRPACAIIGAWFSQKNLLGIKSCVPRACHKKSLQRRLHR